eukprot:8672622-Pyramimonas_sp.AAC.1
MARSTSANCLVYVSYLICRPAMSCGYSPTCATSGLVYVAHGMMRSENLDLPKNNAFRMTIRAMESATCVNWKRVQQSPTAYTLWLVVCR